MTLLLRAKIKETRGDEMRSVIERAEKAISAAASHPLANDLRSKTGELQKVLQAGDQTKADELLDELIRMLAEVEAAAS